MNTTVSLIVAYGRNREIGLNNKLLWNIPEDLKNFKKITDGHHIIMGKNTLESLPGILPNRPHNVLSRNPKYKPENITVFRTLEDFIFVSNQKGLDEVFIIGGAKVYNYAIANNLVDKLYISEIDIECEADTYLNKIDFNQWFLEEKTIHPQIIKEDGKTIPSWTFKIYSKINN